MASKIFGPRKRRTRQHVIADLAVHHVVGLILEEGHTAERTWHDYGYDLVMRTYDSRGFAEPDVVFFQIKASEQLEEIRGCYYHDLDIRNSNLWMYEKLPVILVVYDAALRQAFWQDVQRYFLAKTTRKPTTGMKWVRLSIPKSQCIDRDFIAQIRRRKNEEHL
jgi:hypothetical protein